MEVEKGYKITDCYTCPSTSSGWQFTI